MNSINWHTFRFELETEKNLDHRTPFEKDKCKVVHSYSFRRLQGKIQIVSGKDSDFHRNRLTHSIEVASIAKSIFNNLLYRLQQDKKKNLEDKLIFLNSQKNEDIDTLLDTIGLLHDIGHPPYGHGGEQALNYKMRNYGGFEGNAQTLRLINKVDSLNLTYRTLLGVLKYPATYSALVNVKTYPNLDRRISDQKEITEYLIDNSRWNPPKCYYDSDNQTVLNLLSYITDNERIEFQRSFPAPKPDHKKTKYKTFDCSVMNIADDISYSIHDLEDAIFFRQISMDELVNFFKNQNFIQNWSNYPTLLLSDDLKARKKVIGTLIHEAIIHTCIEENSNFNEPIFRYFVKFENEAIETFIKNLKLLVSNNLIKTQHVKSIIHGGKVLIMQLFDAIDVNPEMLLPTEVFQKYSRQTQEADQKRVIADYISGMTDNYLYKMHQRIFGGNTQSTFDTI